MQDIEKALEKEMDNMQTTTQAGPDLQSMFSTHNSKPSRKQVELEEKLPKIASFFGSLQLEI